MCRNYCVKTLQQVFSPLFSTPLHPTHHIEVRDQMRNVLNQQQQKNKERLRNVMTGNCCIRGSEHDCSQLDFLYGQILL